MTSPLTELKKVKIIVALKLDQENIQYNNEYGDHDEGACEFHAEIESIIEAVENPGASWISIRAASQNVGHREAFIESIERES